MENAAQKSEGVRNSEKCLLENKQIIKTHENIIRNKEKHAYMLCNI